jgi:glycosyltransferase involved in cell wall biosynthesis
MKVIFIAPSFQVLSRQSDSDLIWPLLKELVFLGIEVIVLSKKSKTGRDYIERDRVKVYFINQSISDPTWEDYEASVERFLLASHHEHPVDIVHVLEEINFDLTNLKKAFKFKVVLDVDALQLSRLFSILSFNNQTALGHIQVGLKAVAHFLKSYLTRDRDLLKSADVVLTSSPQQRFFLERYYMYPDSRIFIVPRAFSLSSDESASVAESSSDYKDKIPLPHDAQIILNVTDMSNSLETIQLLKAFERAAVKKSSCYLIIVGDGPTFKEIEFHLYNLALGERAFMLKMLPPEMVSNWIRRCLIFVDLSSIYRQFEGYAIEAMVRKKLVIASELGPLAHVIEDGVDGFLVRPADALNLQKLLLKILEGRVSIETITQAAQEKATRVFSPGRAVDVMHKVYQHAMMREPRS